MAGIVVLLTLPGCPRLHLFSGLNVISKGEELTTLLGVVARTCVCYSLVFVGHTSVITL